MKTLITIAAVFLFVTPTIGCTDSAQSCLDDFVTCHEACSYPPEGEFTNKSACLNYQQCVNICSDAESECNGNVPDAISEPEDVMFYTIEPVDCDNVPE